MGRVGENIMFGSIMSTRHTQGNFNNTNSSVIPFLSRSCISILDSCCKRVYTEHMEGMTERQYCTSGSKTAYSSVHTGISSPGKHKWGWKLVYKELKVV